MSSRENKCQFIKLSSELPIEDKAYVLKVIEGDEEVINNIIVWLTKDL